MSHRQFFKPQSRAAIEMISTVRSDPCFTMDLKRIVACEKYYTLYTIITPDLHAPNRFFIRDKYFDQFKERVLVIGEHGEFHLLNGTEKVNEPIDDYLFSTQSRVFFKTLSEMSPVNGVKFVGLNNTHLHVSTLVLQCELKTDVDLVQFRKKSISSYTINYLIQIDRKGGIAIFCHINGEINDHSPQKVLQKDFLVQSINDIPDLKMRNFYLKYIQPFQKENKPQIKAKL